MSKKNIHKNKKADFRRARLRLDLWSKFVEEVRLYVSGRPFFKRFSFSLDIKPIIPKINLVGGGLFNLNFSTSSNFRFPAIRLSNAPYSLAFKQSLSLTPPSILPLGKVAPKVKMPILNTRIESESSVLLDLLKDLEPLIREEGRKSAKTLLAET